jgi:hypothetical protein
VGSSRKNELRRGDVVVAISPRNRDAAICKRILGMPGDRVCTNAGEGSARTFDTVPKGKVRSSSLHSTPHPMAFAVSLSLHLTHVCGVKASSRLVYRPSNRTPCRSLSYIGNGDTFGLLLRWCHRRFGDDFSSLPREPPPCVTRWHYRNT